MYILSCFLSSFYQHFQQLIGGRGGHGQRECGKQRLGQFIPECAHSVPQEVLRLFGTAWRTWDSNSYGWSKIDTLNVLKIYYFQICSGNWPRRILHRDILSAKAAEACHPQRHHLPGTASPCTRRFFWKRFPGAGNKCSQKKNWSKAKYRLTLNEWRSVVAIPW